MRVGLGLLGGVLGVLVLAGSAANATPVVFTYTDTVASTNIPGVGIGSPVSINVFADNGSASLNSQTWIYGQTNGFTVTASSYSGSFSEVFEHSSTPGDTIFATDASGNVTTFAFFGTEGTSLNSDNFGSWSGDTVFGNFGLNDNFGFFLNSSNDPGDTASWTVRAATTAVPEPFTLSLFGAGIAGAAALRRKKKA